MGSNDLAKQKQCYKYELISNPLNINVNKIVTTIKI